MDNFTYGSDRWGSAGLIGGAPRVKGYFCNGSGFFLHDFYVCLVDLGCTQESPGSIFKHFRIFGDPCDMIRRGKGEGVRRNHRYDARSLLKTVPVQSCRLWWLPVVGKC